MGAKKSRIAAPSRDKAIRGKSPSRCAASSQGPGFYGESHYIVPPTPSKLLKPMAEGRTRREVYGSSIFVPGAGTDGAGNPMISC